MLEMDRGELENWLVVCWDLKTGCKGVLMVQIESRIVRMGLARLIYLMFRGSGLSTPLRAILTTGRIPESRASIRAGGD